MILNIAVGVQTVLSLDVEDLEVDATPEDLMLSYVSGEKGKVTLGASPKYSFSLLTGHCQPNILLCHPCTESLQAQSIRRH